MPVQKLFFVSKKLQAWRKDSREPHGSKRDRQQTATVNSKHQSREARHAHFHQSPQIDHDGLKKRRPLAPDGRLNFYYTPNAFSAWGFF